MLTAYPAERAAALAGVPLSTLHYWARTELLVPGVSAERVELWSYDDLLGLRTIDWLRCEKRVPGDRIVPPTTMPAIRHALRRLPQVRLPLWDEDRRPTLLVDRSDNVHLIGEGDRVESVTGQRELGVDVLDLLAPFGDPAGPHGPDLRRPRPHLRIVPGKLAGEPHVERTRVETQAIAALSLRGYSVGEIEAMDPFLAAQAVEEAVDLEQQLSAYVARAA